MKTYADFLPYVLPDVPGVTVDMATQAIQSTVIEFAERSLIHQATLDPLTLSTGVNTYDLDAGTGLRVQKIMKAFFRGTELVPIAPDDVIDPETYADVIGGYTATKTTPQRYTQRDLSTVTFLPTPDQAYVNAITMRVALVPLRSATKIDDFYYELWAEVIGFGAKARLQTNPGKPYTNVDAASINQARYTSGLNEARQIATRGNVRSTLQVQMRRP